jgi:type II restriction/modification system DNA methylase subunit YeeA
MWIVDFGPAMLESEAALYEAPFEYVSKHVRPTRGDNNRAWYREHWWLHSEPRPGLRAALAKIPRYIGTARLAKHRLFVWFDSQTIPDTQVVAFARPDDYFFGVLHSRAHEGWSLRIGTSLEDRPRYTPSTGFETFPLPWPPGQEPANDPRVAAIAAAAKDLDEKRRMWLEPPGASAEELTYGWEDANPGVVEEDVILTRLLELNRERSKSAQAGVGDGLR